MTERRQLKALVDDGRYRPEPGLIAEAMLRRRGVRALLTGAALSPTGRIPAATTPGRQAA